MSKNSQVRKIDLRANVDLANYRMDVHDYEGFCGCNSLFLNKRIQNWYTRSRGSSDVTGDLRIEANGDMFELWRGNTKLGQVDRNYYKLESYEGDTTRQAEVKNPFPQGKNKCLFINQNKKWSLSETEKKAFIIPSLNWVIIYETTVTTGITLYNDRGEPVASLPKGRYQKVKYVSAYYSATNQNFYVKGNQNSNLAILALTAGDIFITIGYEGSGLGICCVYNINSGTIRYNCLSVLTVRDYELGRYYTSSSGSELFTFDILNYSQLDRIVSVVTFNNEIYMQCVTVGSGGGERNANCIISKNSVKIFDRNYSTSTANTSFFSNPNFNVLSVDSYGESRVKLSLRWGVGDTTVNTNNYESLNGVLPLYVEMHNFSKLIDIGSHDFTINFVNNVARDISHNYKKLVNIEGNEDANGVLTDIIDYGYEEGQSYYIWLIFKKGNVYYKLSLAYAESWEEVVTKVGSDYLIFNTTTYNNAYYIPGNKWFCSCDDWNNRLTWRVKDSTNFEGLVNSRLNQNWQTKNYPVSVSDQLASVISRYAVTGLNMAAYPSSATWDGSSVVYDSSGNPVYTGDWAQGHSLNGYYYPLAWEINTAGMTPFYYDSNYTAPSGVAYDVFMADTSGGTLGALHKVGYADSTGFHSDPDSGTQFIDPSEGNYQFNCPLLDTTYLIFATQAIAIIDNMSYILMNNVNMGNFVLLYREQDVATLTSDDRQFVINGSVYTYRAEAQRILDSNNRWVCDTHLFHYVGYSSRCAYFYCDFDKGLYAFSGDNTMNRLATVEKYNIRYSVGGDSAMLDTLNFPSLDLVLINLFTAVGVIYGDQFAVIDTGNITNWSIDDRRGLILINGVYYSLILANIQAGYTGEIGRLPIKIDTEYYGDPNNEDNTITDTVYLMIDNLNGVLNGNVKLRTDVLQNNKVVKTEEKIFNLKSSDFNENIAQIKYQPKVQEGRGMKLYIESDYEISEMKFAAAPGAVNQTTKRI